VTQRIIVTCDQCGTDLSQCNDGFDHYKFQVEVERIPNLSQSRFAMYVAPPTRQDFCSKRCIGEFYAQ